MFKNILFLFGIILFLNSCSSVRLKRNIQKNITTSFFKNQFSGIYIYDIEKGKTLFNFQGEKYFTPASNTKIFTLFTGLEMLSDSIPAFKYAIDKDTITLQGTGDPTLFHNYFKDSTAFHKIKNFKKVKFITDNISDKRYGAGWAWEDFDSYFSAEKSAFPVYGNVVTIKNDTVLQALPTYFDKRIKVTASGYGRKEYQNSFYYAKDRSQETEIPMIMNDSLLLSLWNDILPNKVSIVKSTTVNPTKVVYSIPSDSLFKRMMHVSDNFLAEQILILASSTMSDTLNSSKVRSYILENQLKDLVQKPRWVDGSGLSRYNLFTPQSFADVLTRMYHKIPRKRLFAFFPVGGESGTLKNWFSGNPKPYIFAKSGTLGNNYNLSGYLLTNSGKVLVFSYMNNHFMHSNKEIKEQMETTFQWLRDNY